MPQVKVNSREYKVMLKAARFAGDEAQAYKAAGQFWRDSAKAFTGLVLGTLGDLNQVQARRLIRFYDTREQHLNNNAYIFRERAAEDGSTREVTLKFRHADRYIAADRDMRPIAKMPMKMKFEEDIKPPFQQLYSYSTTIPVAPERELAAMKHIAELFPGLKKSAVKVGQEEPVEVVDAFTAREVVVGGGSLYLGKRHSVYGSCVLVLWYDHETSGNGPAVAEFSFKYGDRGETYGGGTVRRAYDVFQALQTQLGDWTDKDSKTKTAFVYDKG
jgi:hypothetical protein